jgi:general secretion pathway protein D
VAIRNGRILKIVNRRDAQKRDLPVAMGSDPDQIPRKDEMVTQILPLRFGEAAKLVENIRPLLSDNATISSNEGSNAILLTDTQTNIRRIAQIIKAVDTSVAGISTIHVYPLQYADAKELAQVITQLFQTDTNGGGNPFGNRGGGGGGFGRRGGFGGFGPGGMPGAQQPQSEARQAASRVIAVADQQSNSVVVSAPEETITIITDIVTRIDTSITENSDTRIFHLEHADALETADILNSLYGGVAGTVGSNGQRNNNRPGGQGNNRPPGQQGGSVGGLSDRALLQSQMNAVGDPRTNSLLVTASHDTMAQIAEMIGRLDASDAKKQHVYIHSLEHADADGVANVLRGMLGDQTAISNSQQTGSRLTNRTTTGAAMNTTDSTSNSTRR